MSDDVDGDYIRRNLKNFFRPESAGHEEHKSYKKKFLSSKGKYLSDGGTCQNMFKSSFKSKLNAKVSYSQLTAAKDGLASGSGVKKSKSALARTSKSESKRSR